MIPKPLEILTKRNALIEYYKKRRKITELRNDLLHKRRVMKE